MTVGLRLSESGRATLEKLEGLRLRAYRDGDGWSIGYGHFGVRQGEVITREQADILLASDVRRFETAVNGALLTATQPQFDAFVLFAYNIGAGGMAGSTAVRLHNAGDFMGAADAMRLWNESGGAVNPVLVARREQERALYLSGSGAGGTLPAPPPFEPEPAEPAAGQGSFLVAGVGLVFFCHSCGARSAMAGVEMKVGT